MNDINVFQAILGATEPWAVRAVEVDTTKEVIRIEMEVRQDRRDVVELLAKLDHRQTRLEVELERAFLKEMGGGCSVPLAARARLRGAEADFSVFYSEPDGSRPVRLDEVCRDLSQAEEFARGLAGRVRSRR